MIIKGLCNMFIIIVLLFVAIMIGLIILSGSCLAKGLSNKDEETWKLIALSKKKKKGRLRIEKKI